MNEIKRTIEEARRKNKENYQTYSRKRLIDNLTKKFNTTMIGSLAEIEKEFGELWGQGIDERHLTKTEKKMREKYLNLRTRILNNGNNQLRTAIEEINQYSTEWQKYRTEFFPASTVSKLKEDLNN